MKPTVASYFIAWLLIILMLYGFSHFEFGKRITYYSLWLMILLLVVTHTKELNALIQTANLETPTNFFATPLQQQQQNAGRGGANDSAILPTANR